MERIKLKELIRIHRQWDNFLPNAKTWPTDQLGHVVNCTCMKGDVPFFSAVKMSSYPNSRRPMINSAYICSIRGFLKILESVS